MHACGTTHYLTPFSLRIVTHNYASLSIKMPRESSKCLNKPKKTLFRVITMSEKDYFVKIVQKTISDKDWAPIFEALENLKKSKELEQDASLIHSTLTILLPIREALNDLDRRLRTLEEAIKLKA